MKSIYCVEDNEVFKWDEDVSKYYGYYIETVYDYAREGKTVRSINKRLDMYDGMWPSPVRVHVLGT